MSLERVLRASAIAFVGGAGLVLMFLLQSTDRLLELAFAGQGWDVQSLRIWSIYIWTLAMLALAVPLEVSVVNRMVFVLCVPPLFTVLVTSFVRIIPVGHGALGLSAAIELLLIAAIIAGIMFGAADKRRLAVVVIVTTAVCAATSWAQSV